MAPCRVRSTNLRLHREGSILQASQFRDVTEDFYCADRFSAERDEIAARVGRSQRSPGKRSAPGVVMHHLAAIPGAAVGLTRATV